MVYFSILLTLLISFLDVRKWTKDQVKNSTNTSSDPPKLENWTDNDVQNWILNNKKYPQFAKYANKFKELNGLSLAGLTEQQFISISGNPAIGSALFNAAQELKAKGNSLFPSLIILVFAFLNL